MIVLVIIVLLVLAYIAMGIVNASLITAAFRKACGTRDARVAWRRGLISIADHEQLADALITLREAEPSLSLDECFDVLVVGLLWHCLLAWPTFVTRLPGTISFILEK